MKAASPLKISTLLLAVALASPASLRSEETHYAVAVFDFAAAPDFEGKGEEVSTLLTALLSTHPGLILVERAELSKVLGEFELGLSGNVDASSAAKVGHLTGAQVLVTGRIFRAGEEQFLAAKAIGTETGRVYGELAKYPVGGSISEAAAELADKLAARIGEQGATFLATAETAEERLARLSKLVAGKELPSVYVSIPEEHLSRPVPDPAAQTEIQKTLQDLGFTLVDQEGDADFVVTGEAFSELGTRTANLVSCRARVEIVVKEPAKGSEISVDRQTSVAADLAENVAAKSALQNAGHILAERLLPLMGFVEAPQ